MAISSSSIINARFVALPGSDHLEIITLLLVITDWKLFLLTLALAGTILLVAVTFFSRKFALYGEIKNEGRRRFTDAVNDSVNGLKEIKVLKIADLVNDKMPKVYRDEWFGENEEGVKPEEKDTIEFMDFQCEYLSLISGKSKTLFKHIKPIIQRKTGKRVGVVTRLSKIRSNETNVY